MSDLVKRLYEEAQDNPDSLYWQAAEALSRPAGWVSCEERLPELGQQVWVWNTHYGNAYADEWCELREAPVSFSSKTIVVGVGWLESDPEDISHWMELPPAPGESE